MGWWERLDKTRGSRPRCVLFMDGSREDVASRLTRLVDLRDVTVSPDDTWMPYGKPVLRDGCWHDKPAKEARLGEPNCLVSPKIQLQLQSWWLAVNGRANTPNWDIASTCRIGGEPGLLLVEAKAHANELNDAGKDAKSNRENHKRIGLAIREANEGLRSATGMNWGLSRDDHYQLSNRFAWAWKLASLGVPTVLLYLGFLNACDMAKDGNTFESESEWERTLRDHCDVIVDGTCWGEWLDFMGVPLVPLIRAVEQPFKSDTGQASCDSRA